MQLYRKDTLAPAGPAGASTVRDKDCAAINRRIGPTVLIRDRVDSPAGKGRAVQRASVGAGAFRGIDHEIRNRDFAGFEAQTELLLNGGQGRRSVGFVVGQVEVVEPLEAGFVLYVAGAKSGEK